MLGFFFFFLCGGFCILFSFFYVWHLFCVFLFFSSFLFLFFFFSYGWWEGTSFFFCDSLSCCLSVLTIWICALMVLASVRLYLVKSNWFYFCFCVYFLCFVLLFCFLLEDFFFFYVFFELSLVPTLFLILGWGYQPERLQAGLYMMVYTVSASLPFLLLLLYLGGVIGHFSFFFFWEFLVPVEFFAALFFFFFFVLAFMVKVPVFFFHLWLPKAHVEAPVSGSMILAGVLLKLGGYGLMRICSVLEMFRMTSSDVVIIFVLWGGVITSFICLRQVDLKSLVAYSSVGHMGMFVAGLFSGCWWGWSGGLMMMVGHGLCSSCLFVLSSMGYDLVGSRSVYVVKGLLVFFPYLTLWWFLFVAGNMAGPPTLNLGAELFLLMGVLSFSWVFCFLLGVLGFLAGAYSLYLFVSVNHGKGLVSFGYFFCPKLISFLVFFLHFFPLYFFFLSVEVLFFYPFC